MGSYGSVFIMKLIRLRGFPHYAWIVLVGVIVICTVSTGVRVSFGILIDPLAETFGWSRGGISLANTLEYLIGIPVVLLVGRLAEKINTRYIVITGAVIFTVGMLLTATITQLWQFQLYFGFLVGGLGSASFAVLLPVLLSRWFNQKLGLALGFMWLSFSIGPAVLSPLMSTSIEVSGWSQTFIAFGAIGGTMILIAGFFLRDNPGEKKLVPYGGLVQEPSTGQVASQVESLNVSHLTRTKSFRGLVAVHLFGCFGHSVLLAHVVSMAIFAGISSLTAAGILSTVMAASAISRFAVPLISEKKGARYTLTLAVSLQTIPTLLLLGASDPWLFYSFAFLFGLGYGGEMVGFPIFNRQYYGLNAPLNTIYSYQIAGAMLGMAMGGWIGGALFDWTGIYTWSILVSVGAGLLGVMAALLLPSFKR